MPAAAARHQHGAARHTRCWVAEAESWMERLARPDHGARAEITDTVARAMPTGLEVLVG